MIWSLFKLRSFRGKDKDHLIDLDLWSRSLKKWSCPSMDSGRNGAEPAGEREEGETRRATLLSRKHTYLDSRKLQTYTRCCPEFTHLRWIRRGVGMGMGWGVGRTRCWRLYTLRSYLLTYAFITFLMMFFWPSHFIIHLIEKTWLERFVVLSCSCLLLLRFCLELDIVVVHLSFLDEERVAHVNITHIFSKFYNLY